MNNETREERVYRRCTQILSLFSSQRMTIRLCAEILHVSKSLVHYYIHNHIIYLYPAEYNKICYQLKLNKEQLSKPRRYWDPTFYQYK